MEMLWLIVLCLAVPAMLLGSAGFAFLWAAQRKRAQQKKPQTYSFIPDFRLKTGGMKSQRPGCPETGGRQLQQIRPVSREAKKAKDAQVPIRLAKTGVRIE